MPILEHLAMIILADQPLQARSIVQDWLRSRPVVTNEPAPRTADPRVASLAAGLAELFAERLEQSAPAWAASIGPAPEPLFLVRSAATMHRLRALCERESPLALRRRHIFAPPGYFLFA